MTFTKENTRYCLLAFAEWQNVWAQGYQNENNASISGLWQWHKVFKGALDFPRSPEDFDKYNLIHLNITPNNLHIIPRLFKNINRNKTKVIFNVDYAIDLWTHNFKDVDIFLQEIDRADYIFSVEDVQAQFIAHILKRPVACIPHPVDTEAVIKFRTDDRKPHVGIMVHRYDSNFLLPYYAIKNLDRSKWITHLFGGSCKYEEVGHLYDRIIKHETFPDMMKATAELIVAIDSYTCHSYGRWSAECAVLGIPCIGSPRVTSIKRCFPDITAEMTQPKVIEHLLNELLNNMSFYKSICHYAMNASKYYSYDNCRKMMLDFLNLPN